MDISHEVASCIVVVIFMLGCYLTMRAAYRSDRAGNHGRRIHDDDVDPTK